MPLEDTGGQDETPGPCLAKLHKHQNSMGRTVENAIVQVLNTQVRRLRTSPTVAFER